MSDEIIHGDFRDYLPFPPGVVISDPPYNQDYHYSAYSDKLTDTEYCQLLDDAFNGPKSVVIHYPEETLNVLAPLLMDCQQVVTWVYNSNTAKQSRLISWWGFKPDMRAVGQPYKNPTDKRVAKLIAQGKQARLYDWWDINQVKNVSKKDNPHPCPIPFALAERLVLISTQPGELVIDPFAGSGTILAAAQKHGRRYLGFEIDRTYVDYARARLKVPLMV